jgi:selenide,water dikinase
VLVLTKPIGTGVISQGVKVGRATADVLGTVVAGMAALNRDACAAMIEAGPSAATDVTGFGLLGHMHEMVHASGVSAEISAAAVPLYPGAHALAQAGVLPGGSRRNDEYFSRWIDWKGPIDAATRALLTDAQTSGGLLISMPADRLPSLREGLRRRGVLCAEIGRIVATDDHRAGRITVG